MDCMILMETERVASNLKDRPIMNTDDQEGGGGDNCLTPPLKMSSPRNCNTVADDQSVDTKLSGDSGGTTSIAVISPRRKDPDRIKKDREREERVRQARERLEEERKKKLIELQEQQRQAQENRDKQLELRRKKIEDLRRREMERRAEVEKRRRERETAEKSRRETLLQKAEERVARYEAWKRGGQKGGRGHVMGFGSGTPRDICQPLERSRRSSSHSALVRHSPNGSDSDYSFRPQRRALSACSTVRRHCCVDLNRSGPPPGCAMPANKQLSVSTSVLYHKRHSDFSSSGALNVSNRPDSLLALNTIPEGRRSVLAPSTPATRHKSVMSLSTPSPGTTSVKLRENKSPRKPRPASVASSMPSFVGTDSPKSASPRSQSTDRLARDRPRSRGAVSASRADDKDAEEKKTTPDKPGVKISRKTLDRLSTPRQVPAKDGDSKESSSTPRRETTIVRTTPRKAYSTSNLAMPRQKPSLREKTTKEAAAAAKSQQQTPKEKAVRPPKPKDTPNKTPRPTPPSTSSPLTIDPTAAASPRAESPAASSSPARLLSPTPAADEDGGSSASQARVTPTPAENPVIEITQPGSSPAPEEKSAVETPQPTSSTPTPMDKSTAEASPSRSTPTPMEKSTADITAEEYKARLAEKRRQAREKAEREAEEERRRKEEEERLEQERQRQEEEEEKRREEEAMRMAAEARKAEEERLQKAIEAEEARRAEEAARLEQEKLAKEEAERKAKEEAERLEQEKLEKARREEEERLERKKRLEMIMKRVKTDNAGEGGKDTPRSIGSSPVRTVAAASAPAPSDSAPAEPDSKPAPNTSTQPPAAAAVAAAAAEAEERKGSVDSSADESRSSPGAPLSPAITSSPVPFAVQDTPSIPQSSSQENMLEVKEDSTPASSRSESPVVPALSTPRGSMSEAGSDRPKFKSPLLQKLVEGRDDVGASPGDTPKFKSPLLQNLLSKTRVGARMGLAQDYSRSSPDLSQVEQGSDRRSSNASPSAMAMSTSMIDMDTVNSSASKETNKMSSSMIDMNSVNSASKEELNRNEEKEVDTSEDNSSSSHSSPTHLSRKARVSNGDRDRQTESPPPAQDSSSVTMETSASVETSAAPEAVTVGSSSVLWNAQDSGVSLGADELQSSVPSMEVSLNGHTPPLAAQGQDLVDSSISMQSVDSLTPALTDSAAGSGPAPQSPSQEHSSEDKNFEELIDLSIKNNSNSTKMNNSDDLVNFHKLEEGSGESDSLPPPIIAFEDTSMRKHQDVSDLLS